MGILNKATKTFFDENRGRYITYEIPFDCLGENIASEIIEAFSQLTGHYHARSRDQAWRSVTRFVRYLWLCHFDENSDGVDIVTGFGNHIKENKQLKKSNGVHYVFVKRLVNWLSETTGKNYWKGHDAQYVDFKREAHTFRGNDLSSEQLKTIVDACKASIARIKHQFSLREKVLSGGEVTDQDLPRKDRDKLKRLLAFESQGIWTKAEIATAGGATMTKDGFRELAAFRELTQEACLPIYLMLMIHTAANPYALMEVKKDCMVTNPMDVGSVYLNWGKGRASKAQQLSLSKSGNYSVFTLVNLVVDMTAPIRHLAADADRDLLFITRHGGKSKRLSSQGLHNYLAAFREQNNLPYFTFSDIRRTIAELVFSRTKSIEEVANVLQHKNHKTTHLYLRSDTAKQQSYQNVAKFQGLMLSVVTATSHTSPERYETVYGFECASPLSGEVGRSRKGEPCLEFLMCASCKHALIPIDDTMVIARIIRAREHLKEMSSKSMLDSESRVRYESVYKPILDIIETEILAKVKGSMLKEAEKAADNLVRLPVMY